MKSILPAQSSPNWFSMLSGLGNEHGLKKWDDKPDVFHWASTIFRVYKEQKPSMKTGVFYNWKVIGDLVENTYLDSRKYFKTSKKVALEAGKFIKKNKPGLTFIYFGDVDSAGHRFGWGSEPYNRSVRKIDRYIGYILKKIDEAGMKERTLVIVTSDHGGKNKGHGEGDDLNRNVPFIAFTPNDLDSGEIEKPTNIYDVAPTIAYSLGIGHPFNWKGRALKEIYNKDYINFEEYLPLVEPEFVEATAATSWGTGSGYLFSKGHFYRMDLLKGKLDQGANSNWNFPGLNSFHNGPSDIDAIFKNNNHEAFIFKGNEYIKYNLEEGTVFPGYPKIINSNNWNGLSKFEGRGRKIDAAFSYGNHKVVFFKKDKIAILDLRSGKSLDGFPAKISKVFPELAKFKGGARDIDAAINWGNGKAYIFKGKEYLRLDLKKGSVDPNFPKIIE